VLRSIVGGNPLARGNVQKNQLVLRDLRRFSLRATAVHDEIKPERGRNPFLAHGVLFVPETWLLPLTDALHRARKAHSYFDEIHWREIKGASRHSKPYSVARAWIEYYIGTALRGCPFKAFIVEDGVNRSFPYPSDEGYPEHLFRSTMSTFVGGIAWSFYKESKLLVDVVFDETDSELDREVARRISSELQAECNTRRITSTKRYPWTRIEPVRFVSSNPKQVSSEDWLFSELIQLCDLLLGASFQALKLMPEPDKAGRRQLARSITKVLADTLELPWLQDHQVHRKFSVSLYPDKYNFAYPAAQRMLRLPEDAKQLTMTSVA
jgi:hypothetical protein